MASETANLKPQLFLEKLKLGVTGTIILMVYRMWDVYALTGHYLSTDFVVCDAKPNKDEYQPDGFIIYPFQLVEFDNLKTTNKKYLIDVVGYVTNVGRTVHHKTSLKTPDFHLANSGGQAIRVTLLCSLGELLIEKRTSHVGVYSIVLTYLIVKQYNGQLYLSSTSSTLILDDEQTPIVKYLKADSSGAEFSKTKNGWNFPSCGGEKCKKNVTCSSGHFYCESCNKEVDYPVLRYRLKLKVSDDTAEAPSTHWSSEVTPSMSTTHMKASLAKGLRPSVATPSKPIKDKKHKSWALKTLMWRLHLFWIHRCDQGGWRLSGHKKEQKTCYE
nr:hypothetical protein [Tanacetum cinerariifolium]